MPPKGFNCKRCGHCCRFLDAFCTTVSEADIIMWEKAGRWDIIDWVESTEIGDGIWFHPETREEVKRCPWLRKKRGKDEYYCRIEGLKPAHCRDYPLSRRHARHTGCRGFE
jgi:Fe-S-cluster containining protein